MGAERCCELGSLKVQNRSLHSVRSCEQLHWMDQSNEVR